MKQIILLMFLLSVSFALDRSAFTLDHVETGFGHGCQYYPVDASLSPTNTLLAKPTSQIVSDMNTVSNGGWEYLNTYESSRLSPVIECSDVPVPGTKNASVQTECNQTGTTLERSNINEWIPMSNTHEFSKGEITQLRYCADYDMILGPTGWAVSADMIPTFNNNVYPGYAWFNLSLQYRWKCEYNAENLTAENVTVPIPCVMDTAALIASTHALSDCADFMPALDNGTGLSMELENNTCDTTDTAFHVRTPVDTSDPSSWYFWMYYGNTTTVISISDGCAVYPDYEAIYHFGDGAFSGTAYDSSCGDNNGTYTGSSHLAHDPTTCAFGQCAFMDANGEYIVGTGHNAQLGNTTVSMWLYHNSSMTPSTDGDVIWGDPAADCYWYPGFGAALQSLRFSCEVGKTMISDDQIFVNDTLSLYVMRLDNVTMGNWNYSKNGSSITTTNPHTGIANSGMATYHIGNGKYPGTHFTGYIDEFRLSATRRSDTYIRAEYELIAVQTGSEESYVMPPVIPSINLTPTHPYIETNLNCSFYAEDNDSALLNITVVWYKDGTYDQNETLTNEAANQTFSFALLYTNTSYTEKWSCTGRADDGVTETSNATGNVTIYNDPPEITSMQIIPNPAYKDSSLTCSAIINDNNTALVSATFRWYNGGILQSYNSYTQARNTSFSDISVVAHPQETNWTCQINASDVDNMVWQNSSVIITNRLPTINSVVITPLVAYNYTTLTCTASISDADADPISGMFIWYLNGTISIYNDTYSGSPGSHHTTLSDSYTDVGDNWSCYVNVTDTFNSSSMLSINKTISIGAIGGTSNVTFSSNFTYTEFTAYMTTFYDDYTPYILVILSYGFAFLVTRRYPATFISGAVGLILAFYLTTNILFLAAGILSLLIGFAYKQASG